MKQMRAKKEDFPFSNPDNFSRPNLSKQFV